MKQIFYGPAGYGKSHLILHGLIQKGNLVIITTNGIQLELDTVGLQDVDIKTIPVSVEKGSEKSSSHISIEVKGVYEKSRDNIIGFDLLTISTEYEGMAMDEILDWLEKTGISNSHNHTIVFINIPKEIKIPSFIDRIEKWNSDVVIDQMINERLPMCIDHYLHTIRMSGKWFEIPVFVPMCRMNSNTLLKFDKLGGIEQKKRMDERLAKNYELSDLNDGKEYKSFAEMPKRLGAKEIKLEQSTNPTINPFEPMYEVYGKSKKEFIKGLSDLIPVDIIKETEEFIRISLKVQPVTDEEIYTFRAKYIKLLESLSGSIELIKL